MSSALTSGSWHQRSTAPESTTRSRTPTSSTNDTHTLRLQGLNPLASAPTATPYDGKGRPRPAANLAGSSLTCLDFATCDARWTSHAKRLVLRAHASPPSWGCRGEACARCLRLRRVFNCGLMRGGRATLVPKTENPQPTTLKNWRFKTRFFASFLFAFEKK